MENKGLLYGSLWNSAITPWNSVLVLKSITQITTEDSQRTTEEFIDVYF